jgi:DNA end-binding protein Ku
VLLREALAASDRMAVVKVALRQREALAVLRVRDKVIVLQTLLWPDEVREPDFDVLSTEVELRPQELAMAGSLIESLAADFAPEQFEDSYAKAVSALVEAKLEGAAPAPAAAAQVEGGEDLVDLLTALQRSVERARGARTDGGSGPTAAEPEQPARRTAPKKGTTAKKDPAPRADAAKATPKKAAPRKSA